MAHSLSTAQVGKALMLHCATAQIIRQHAIGQFCHSLLHMQCAIDEPVGGLHLQDGALLEMPVLRQTNR